MLEELFSSYILTKNLFLISRENARNTVAVEIWDFVVTKYPSDNGY